jgi:hemoglobin
MKTILISIWLSMGLALTGCGSGAGQAQEDREFHTSGSRDADQRAAQIVAKDEQLKGKQSASDSQSKAEQRKEAGNPAANPETAKAKDEKKSLYDRLGGEKGITAIVEDFTARALADPRVNWERKGITRGGINFKRNVSIEWKPTEEQIKTMKTHIAQFLALATGGPTKYEGKEMTEAHKALHITNAEFDAAIGDFKATLDKLGVAKEEQKEVLAILESTRPQISEER